MDQKTDFLWMSVSELRQGYHAKHFSPVEVTEEFLKRIDSVNEEMKVYITISHEEAIKAAKQAEKEISGGQDRGPLHGVPVAVKDLMDTRGIRTTYGSLMFDEHIPDEDAAVVKNLRDAGTVILGKTNTDPFAFGVTTENPHYGTATNPWNPNHVSGGSSGGSAVAVSSGLATVAIGSDTAGSVRIPAACCGIVGIKPSAGIVSRIGVLPLSWTLDHVGPFARSPEDAAYLLNTLAGFDTRDPLTLEHRVIGEWESKQFDSITVGVPKNWFFDHIDLEVKAIVMDAVEKIGGLGAEIVEVEIPNTERYFYVFSSIGRAEAAYAHEFLRERADEYLPGFRDFLEDGRAMTTMNFIDASRERERIRGGLVQVLDSVDILVTPTMPMEPPIFEQAEFKVGKHKEDVHNALMRIMYPFNLSGQPAVSVPCGKTKAGLPVGLQIASQHGKDWEILGFADAWLKSYPFEHPNF